MKSGGSSLFPRRLVHGFVAFTLILIGLAQATDDAAAQASGIEGNTFTGAFFAWTVTWDEDVWAVADLTDAEDADFLQLESVEGQPFGFANIMAVSAYGGDPAACVENFVDDVLISESVSNVREATGVDLPRAPRGWQNAAFSYTSTGESGPFDFIDYVECRTLVEDEAVLLAWMTTVEEDFDRVVVNFGDLLDGIDIEEVDDRSDRTDPDTTGAADDDGDVDSSDSPTGIEGNSYTSPTYGYTVEWDPDVWTANPEWELIAEGSTSADRLSLQTALGDENAYLDLTAQAAYEGDANVCLDAKVALLRLEKGVISYEPLVDRRGNPVAGESDDGGVFAAYALTSDANGDGVVTEAVHYIECRTLVEGEAELDIFLSATPDNYEQALERVQKVVDTIEFANEP